MSSVRVEEAGDGTEWDKFVASNSRGSFFHTYVWKDFLAEHGLEPLYLVARDHQRGIAAIYPFCLSPILGGLAHSLLFLPHSPSGGPLFANPRHIEPLSTLFMNSIRSKVLEKRIPIILTTVTDPRVSAALSTERATVSSTHGIFVLDLNTRPPEQIWSSTFSKRGRQRNAIRRIEKEGFTTTLARETPDLSGFYHLYAHTVIRAGGRPYPYSFLYDIWSTMHPKYFNVLLVKRGDTLVGGAGFFSYPRRATLYIHFGAYSRKPGGIPDEVFLFVFWRVLLWARDNGYTRIDLGPSRADPADGSFRFKNQFCGDFSKTYTIKSTTLPTMALALLGRLKRMMPTFA